MTTDLSPLASQLLQRDSKLWASYPEQAQHHIAQRLGWLRVFSESWYEQVAKKSLEQRIQAWNPASRHLLWLGMGGSSLFPDVVRRITQATNVAVLDSTHPDQARTLHERVGRQAFGVGLASKSGSTLEVQALQAYFASLHTMAPELTLAITDPESPLHQEMKGRPQTLDPLLNPADIGGRFSALSYFGLFPATLMGLNPDVMMAKATDLFYNPMPAVDLGLALAQAVQAGHYQLRVTLPDAWNPFEDWLEQLLAESTGKQGMGLLPCTAEARPHASVRYHVSYLDDVNADFHVRPTGSSPEDLATECLRWEIATAICGHALGVNPFDEPHVRLSKTHTQRALSQPMNFAQESAHAARAKLDRLLHVVRPTDYVALLAFVEMSEVNHTYLTRLQTQVQSQTGVACTLGYGPRYLHSTGQLHKGGPLCGRFVVITDEPTDLDIPNYPHSFKALIHAQARGDIQALEEVGQRVTHLHGQTVQAVCDSLC